MENWKKAMVAATAGASVYMFVRKKPAAGIILAGASLVTLATAYPKHFAKVRRVLPEYFGKGLQLADFAARAGQQISKYAEERGKRVMREVQP